MQRFLRDWYGIDYQPRLREDGKVAINLLEKVQPGADFNRLFYETLSRHHYMLMKPVNGCMTGSDLMHRDLRRECQGMWHSQIADIGMMRNELKKHFGIVGYQPFRGLEPLRSPDSAHTVSTASTTDSHARNSSGRDTSWPATTWHPGVSTNEQIDLNFRVLGAALGTAAGAQTMQTLPRSTRAGHRSFQVRYGDPNSPEHGSLEPAPDAETATCPACSSSPSP